MRNVLLIARRELAAYLRTMSGYVIIAGILFIHSLLFNAFALGSGNRLSSDVISDFFYFSSGCTMACAILLSMRLLAEERQSGTLNLLYSSPVRDIEIVLGKYLSGLGFLALYLLSTAYMPLLVMAFGKVSFGQLAAGYFGLLLVGSACMALGTFGSSLTRSQVLAAIITTVLVVFLVVAWLLPRVTDRPLNEILGVFAIYPHFKPFETGLIHLKHVAYFVLVSYVGLFGATRVLEARRWR
jgi:ABC-2 type transport system permease protein